MSADKEFLREVVADTVCCDVSEISDTTDFINDLDVSSVQMLEIVAAIEDEYDIEVKAADLKKYNTIEKIMEILESMDLGD